MKSIIVVFALCLGVASAIDWNTVYPTYEIKQWREAFPKLASISPIPTGKTYLQSGRIIGGQEATPNQFPYQVMVLSQYPSGWGACGGSLISANFILTAANCVDENAGVSTILVVAGAHDWTDESEPTQQELIVYETIMNPDWNPVNLEADLAILFVDTFYYSEYVARTVLINADAGNFVGSIGRISGWGRTHDDDQNISSFLNFVDVTIISNTDCNDIYGVVGAGHMCTSAASGGNICGGDAGGPLTVAGVQVGVISFGASSGCDYNFPAGHTRLSTYRAWIQEITGY